MIDSNSTTFYAKYHSTTARGFNIFIVHGTEEELQAYVKSFLTSGVEPQYLTQADKVTPILNPETGLKQPLAFNKNTYIVTELEDARFPMTYSSERRTYNVDTTLCSLVMQSMNAFPGRDADWCIADARKKLSRMNAQALDATPTAPESNEDSEEAVAEEPKASAQSAVAKALAKKRATSEK